MENTNFEPSAGESKSLGETLLLRIRSVFSNVSIQRRPRRLKLCETLSLGDKRVLALVECGSELFLVGATAQNISLLQTLSVSKEGDQKSGL